MLARGVLWTWFPGWSFYSMYLRIHAFVMPRKQPILLEQLIAPGPNSTNIIPSPIVVLCMSFPFSWIHTVLSLNTSKLTGNLVLTGSQTQKRRLSHFVKVIMMQKLTIVWTACSPHSRQLTQRWNHGNMDLERGKRRKDIQFEQWKWRCMWLAELIVQNKQQLSTCVSIGWLSASIFRHYLVLKM